ncbi:MAG: site-specific integrase [Firmicutes bacterium]|nr:site-specific integrase [Bacillota bacterium]
MKKEFDIDVKSYIRQKNDSFYVVLIYKNIAGKRKEKWFPTKLPVRGNKKKAESMADDILRNFVIPAEDLYIGQRIDTKATNAKFLNADNTNDAFQNTAIEIPRERLSELSLNVLGKEQVANLLFSDYIKMFLPVVKRRQIEIVTYNGYEANVKSPIGPYFSKKAIKLKDLTGKDIQEFYDEQLRRVKPNTVIHYHAIIRLSLCYARKQGYITVNPIDEVDKPEKNQYVGKFYSAEELKKLFETVKDTYLEIPVLMGGFYGLRRSECVGLRWSAFDFEDNIFYVNHTVNVVVEDGKKRIIAKDRAKTKSSLRALPLNESVKTRLLELKEKQEQYIRKFKSSYNREWDDYLMVDELGNLILPDYVTDAFARVLRKNNLRKIRFHDLRHTCATLLLNKGKGTVTIKDIQLWLGHSDFATTANIYSHLDASSKMASLGTLSDAVEL